MATSSYEYMQSSYGGSVNFLMCWGLQILMEYFFHIHAHNLACLLSILTHFLYTFIFTAFGNTTKHTIRGVFL